MSGGYATLTPIGLFFPNMVICRWNAVISPVNNLHLCLHIDFDIVS
jgi:hypothetical protein